MKRQKYLETLVNPGQSQSFVKNPRPVAYQSPLGPHLEQIRSWRRARKTWREIAELLRKEHGINRTLQAVQSFFKSATSPKRRVPLGFEDSTAPPVPAGPTQPVSARPSGPLTAEQQPSHAAAIEAARARAKARTQTKEKAKWDLGYDPTKPLKDQ